MNYADKSIHREILKTMDEKLKDKQGAVINGTPLDYAQYREHVGYIRALGDVANWLDEIVAELEKGDR